MPQNDSRFNIKITYGVNSFDSIRDEYGNAPMPMPPFTGNATWEWLKDFLTDCAKVPRLRDTKETHTPWISPMILRDDSHGRCLDNIVAMSSWIGVDLDAPGWTISRIDDAMGGCHVAGGCERIVYTTTKSKAEYQRWRIISRLNREISREEYGGMWNWLNETFDRQLDIKTRNCGRILYVPAQWSGADNRLYHRSGCAFDVDVCLRKCPPAPLVAVPMMAALEIVQAAPEEEPVITAKMIERACGEAEGGRLYGLMVGAASRYKMHGWPLTASELANAGVMASSIISPGKPRPNLLREATRAISYAQSHVETKNAWQIFQDKIRYKLRHSKGTKS